MLVVGTLAPTVGGIAAAIADQVEGLRGRGIEVDVLNTGRARRPEPGRPSMTNVFSATVDATRTYRQADRSRPRLTAVHTVGSPLLPLLRAFGLVVAARAAGSRVVVHLHGYDIETSVRCGGRTYRLAMRLLVRMSDGVLTLDDQVRQCLVEIVEPRKVHVLPNCVDCTHYAPGPNDNRPPRFLFVGTVGRRKGVVDLLEALDRTVEPVICEFVGGAGEESRRAFEEVVEQAGGLIADGRATFHGELPRDAVRERLRTASALVLPSHAEGMPVAVLEAMACALPVIVTPVGSIGELVREAGCGIVVPVGAPVELAAALDRLATDGEARRRFGEAGRRAVERAHSADAVVDQLARLYGSLSS